MKADLLKYKPEDIEYVLDENVADMFPHELDFLSLEGESLMGSKPIKSKRDALNFVERNFTCTYPDGEIAVRKLDEYEKENIRSEYCALTEELLPVRKAELEEAIERAKKLKRDAEEALASVVQDIAAYAAQVKQGTKELILKSKDTFCIALSGYYLIYTWDEKRKTFVLASGYEIPDSTDIWANDKKNREAMLQIFGVEYEPAERKPSEDSFDMPM